MFRGPFFSGHGVYLVPFIVELRSVQFLLNEYVMLCYMLTCYGCLLGTIVQNIIFAISGMYGLDCIVKQISRCSCTLLR